MEPSKRQNKILVFSVGALAILLWLLVWLFGPKSERIEPETQIPISLVALQSEPVQMKEEPAKELIPDTWGRDPFETPYLVQPEDTKTSSEKNGKPRPQPERGGAQYKLSTILMSGSKRLAVINEKVYAVGDQIGSETISSITLDHVVLSGAGGERLLEVPQPKTKVSVEDAGKR